MSKLTRWTLPGLTFVMGGLLGAGLLSVPVMNAVRAAAVDKAALEEAYEDLNKKVTALQEGSSLLARVAHLATPSVVHIESRRNVPNKGVVEETGSGVLVTGSDGKGTYVVTNRHVIDGAIPGNISISLFDGRVINPEDIRADRDTDLAVLKVSASNLAPARWADSDKVDIGHMVLAVGSPFGLSQSVTFGIISAKGRRKLKLGTTAVLNQDFLQTDAAINPGNSGGPLIDLQGRIIGINTAIASSSGGNEGIGFSIPSNLVRRVMDQLLEYGVVQRAYLGVRLDPAFDLRSASRLKLDRIAGARVTEVYPNTAASKANLLYDDVILSFDGVDVEDENHLINLVSLTPFGKKVRMVVWRGSQKVPVIVQLGDRAEMREQSSAPQPELGLPPIKPASLPAGLKLAPLDFQIKETHRLPARASGVLVNDVDQSSIWRGVLEAGDLIVEIDQWPVSSETEVASVLHAGRSLPTIPIRLMRLEGGESIEHIVQLPHTALQ